MRKGYLAVIAVAMTLVLPPAAQAEQRYVTPTGAGEACSQTAPCSLKEGVTKAKEADEVIVGTGSYTVDSFLQIKPPSPRIYIHGDPSGPMPQIVTQGPQFAFLPEAELVRFAYLDITNSGANKTAAYCGPRGSMERMKLTVTGGEYAYGLSLVSQCSASNILIRAEGEHAHGVVGSAVTAIGGEQLTNATVIVGGEESVGVESLCELCFTSINTLSLTNTIVHGAGVDLQTPSSEGGFIAVSHSDFASTKAGVPGAIEDLGGNLAAAPHFADAAAGNFAEAPDSPTIGVGAVGAEIGALDLAGNPRATEGRVDIGAYQYVPPPKTTAAGSAGGVRTLKIEPKRFRAGSRGGPVAGGIRPSRPPVGAQVTYTMSGPATVNFGVSRKVVGRKVGKRCKQRSGANAGHGKCTFFVPVKGSFTQQGATGSNSFVFSGRIGGKTLKAGAYALTAEAGHLVSARFEIGGLRRKHRR
jgi:hypothetical protein